MDVAPVVAEAAPPAVAALPPVVAPPAAAVDVAPVVGRVAGEAAPPAAPAVDVAPVVAEAAPPAAVAAAAAVAQGSSSIPHTSFKFWMNVSMLGSAFPSLQKCGGVGCGELVLVGEITSFGVREI